jgi:hypothetical protein
MAERGVALLAAAASTVGAATVVNAAVVGFIQLLLLQQKQHVEEDDEWTIARVRRVRDRRRAVQLQRRHRVQAYCAFALSQIQMGVSSLGRRLGAEEITLYHNRNQTNPAVTTPRRGAVVIPL